MNRQENGHSLARLVKNVRFELPRKLTAGAGVGDEGSRSGGRFIDIHAEPFEITRWRPSFPFCLHACMRGPVLDLCADKAHHVPSPLPTKMVERLALGW